MLGQCGMGDLSVINLFSAEYLGTGFPYLLEKAAKYLNDFEKSDLHKVETSTINIYKLDDVYKLVIAVVVSCDDN